MTYKNAYKLKLKTNGKRTPKSKQRSIMMRKSRAAKRARFDY